MNLKELRELKPSTIQERYQIEVAAQIAELNENLQKFFEKMDRFLAQQNQIAGTEARSQTTTTKRTPIAEK